MGTRQKVTRPQQNAKHDSCRATAQRPSRSKTDQEGYGATTENGVIGRTAAVERVECGFGTKRARSH
jgi:hypothetical protein